MTLTHNPLSKRITIELRLELRTLHKLNAIADKRGDTLREATVTALLDEFGDAYLASLPDRTDDEDEQP
jgi:hypothetical protein